MICVQFKIVETFVFVKTQSVKRKIKKFFFFQYVNHDYLYMWVIDY